MNVGVESHLLIEFLTPELPAGYIPTFNADGLPSPDRKLRKIEAALTAKSYCTIFLGAGGFFRDTQGPCTSRMP